MELSPLSEPHLYIYIYRAIAFKRIARIYGAITFKRTALSSLLSLQYNAGWKKALPREVTVVELSRNLPTFYGYQTIITAYTTAHC